MCFWSTPCFIYNLSTEQRGCLVQIDNFMVSAQQKQMGVWTLVSPGAHIMTELVDCVKYGLAPGCHTWPRKGSLPNGEAQLAACQKGLAGLSIEGYLPIPMFSWGLLIMQ